MRPADDAVLLETDGLSPEEVVDRLVLLVAERRP
jgi:cytidylate kinase